MIQLSCKLTALRFDDMLADYVRRPSISVKFESNFNILLRKGCQKRCCRVNHDARKDLLKGSLGEIESWGPC